MLYTPAATTKNTYFSSHVPVSTGRQVPIIAAQSTGTQESISLHNPVVWPAGCRVAAGAIGRWLADESTVEQ